MQLWHMAFTKADLGCRSQISGRMPQPQGSEHDATDQAHHLPSSRKRSAAAKPPWRWNPRNMQCTCIMWTCCQRLLVTKATGVAVLTVMRLTTATPDHESLEAERRMIEMSRFNVPKPISNRIWSRCSDWSTGTELHSKCMYLKANLACAGDMDPRPVPEQAVKVCRK